jgi:hypothetical protein
MKARHASSHFGASQHAYSQQLHGSETVGVLVREHITREGGPRRAGAVEDVLKAFYPAAEYEGKGIKHGERATVHPSTRSAPYTSHVYYKSISAHAFSQVSISPGIAITAMAQGKINKSPVSDRYPRCGAVSAIQLRRPESAHPCG